MKDKLTVFNAEDIYETEIKPLAEKINVICKANKIPFILGVCVSNDEEDSKYEYTANLCGSNEIKLKDDKITDFLRILAGFKIKTQTELEGAYTIELEDETEMDFTDVEEE